MASAAHRRPSSAVAPRTGKRSHPGMVTAAALVAGILASTGLGTSPAAAVSTSAALSGGAPAPGTIFVLNGGAAQNGTGTGSVTLYRPGASGDARPESKITKGINLPGSLTLDPSGNLWVAGVSGVVEYSKTELANASPVPTRRIPGGPENLTSDPSGNLWVDTGGPVEEFTKEQLTKAGPLRPKFTLVGNDDCSLNSDPSGDLWEGSTDDTVAEFTKAGLAKAGLAKAGAAALPNVTITSHSLNGPCKPGFDRAGDLWAGNYNTNTVVEFTKSELAKSGSPAPKVVITSSKYYAPGDVAVSSSGDLWVPYFGGTSWAVAEFTKAQLARSGSPRPVVTIAGPHTGLNNPWAVAIEP